MYRIILKYDIDSGYANLRCVEADLNQSTDIFNVNDKLRNSTSFCGVGIHVQQQIQDALQNAKKEIESRRGYKSDFMIEGREIIFEEVE